MTTIIKTAYELVKIDPSRYAPPAGWWAVCRDSYDNSTHSKGPFQTKLQAADYGDWWLETRNPQFLRG